jgi:hypothetical protein
MSHIYTIYIGPYAQWMVPVGYHKKSQSPSSRAMFEEIRGQVPCLTDSSDPPVVVQGKKQFTLECWVASFHRETRHLAPRQFSWSSSAPDLQITTFAGFDVEGELHWFRQTFDYSLEKLANYYGMPPAIHWGVVPML